MPIDAVWSGPDYADQRGDKFTRELERIVKKAEEDLGPVPAR